MSQFRVAGDAQQDVDAMWAFIAADRPREADGLLAALFRAFRYLGEYPDAGRAIGHVAGAPARRYPVRKYKAVVIFRREGDVTVILRVYGRGRDLGALLDEDTREGG